MCSSDKGRLMRLLDGHMVFIMVGRSRSMLGVHTPGGVGLGHGLQCWRCNGW